MKRSWFWIVLLILFFLVGTIGCSGTPKRGKTEPKEKMAIPSEPVNPPPTPEPSWTPEERERVSSKEVKGRPRERMLEETIAAPPPGKAVPTPPSMTPPPLPPSSMAGGQPEKARNTKFVLNFDNADIFEVIRVMGEMLKINYIIDPRVKGAVNIHTSGQISSEDAFPIFQSILKLNGATAVQKGIIYEIVPFGDAKKLHTSALLTTREEDRKLVEEKYAIQIIPLKYIPVTEVSKMIKPFLTDGADIVEYPLHNILIIGDLTSNIRKTLEIIDLFDVDIFTDMRLRIYPVLNADVNEIAKEMERIFTSFEVSLKSARGVGITFTPITRINSLLVVSGIPNIFEKVEKWLRELDKVPAEGTKLSVFVYYVQNGKAKDLAEVLKQVYAPSKEKKTEFKERVLTGGPAAGSTSLGAPGSGNPPEGQRSIKAAPATPAASPSGTPSLAQEESGALPEGEIGIVVDETTNGLIIRAFQRDYKNIMETIKKLDIYPKQVLIEVLLAEVTLTDLTKYGLEFSTFTDSFVRGATTYAYTVGMGGTVVDPAQFTSGLRYAVSASGKLAAAINASAAEDLLKVISSPHILASNNKEAKIQIGSSQPVLTNTYTTTGTSSPGVVEGSIEYKDIGIILMVTPRISDGKLVTMEISVEQSSVGTTKLGNLADVPFFPKKTAKTTLSIMEGQTIVIGGLIEDSKDVGTSGVPLLSRIPVIGALFGYHTYNVGKTETLLLMTPHVIDTEESSRMVTQEFREKVQSIKKELGRKKSIYDKKVVMPLKDAIDTGNGNK